MEEYKFREPVYKEFTVNNETIGKWVKLVKIAEYDTKGKVIYQLLGFNHLLLLDGNEIYAIPDKENNVEWYKTWCSYDSHGNLILKKEEHYIKEKNSKEERDVTVSRYNLKYDSKGNLIYCKHEENWEGDERPAEEFFFEYDGKGNKIYGKYFEKGYCLEENYWEIYERICHFEYDDRGNLIHLTNSCKSKNHSFITSNHSYQYEFDNDGKLLCIKPDSGPCCRRGYDRNGNIVYTKDFVFDFIPSYNNTKGLLYFDPKCEIFYEYEFYDDGKPRRAFLYATPESFPSW